ncbi:histone-lysine N-methyltransferase trithorax [Malaya genurostris]|uniref:histone-lysine N-methyltransferase trithorax n=1 Tax=Malaya genurostris TaxID=325434 RepID=UPI0026F3D00D|nr:histone-lysine N-methyltransferase trithorax [Malaya genurostris]
MGKSKFPGKPSRLVNKKRVSVLSSAGLNTLASSSSSDEDNNQNQQQENSSTTEKLNQNQQSLIQSQEQQRHQQQQKQNQQPSPKVSTLLDNEEIDQDGDDDVSKHNTGDDSENGEDDEDEDDDEEDDDDDDDDDDDEDEDGDDNDIEERNGSDDQGREGGEENDRNGQHDNPKHQSEQTDDECPLNGAESNLRALNNTDKQTSVSQPPTGNSFEMKPSSLSAAISSSASSTPVESLAAQYVPSDDSTMAKSSAVEQSSVPDAGAGPTVPPPDGPPKPKKKTVTFHSTLETSDENMVKKVYNPATVPLIPIIKKECLARPIRLKKSFNRKMKKRLQRLAMQAATAAAKSECIVRPSRLTEIIQKSSKLEDANISSEPTSSFSAGISSLNASEDHHSPSLSQDTVPFGVTENVDPADSRNLESGGTQFGDKRFILPKRSAHSSRVIKPNKRFLDEFELEIKKKNKNLAAAQAAATAAAAAATSTSAATAATATTAAAAVVPSVVPSTSASCSSGANVGKISSKENGGDRSNYFGDKLFKNEADSKNELDDSAKTDDNDNSENSDDGKRKREKAKKDTLVDEHSKKPGKTDGKESTESGEPEPVRPPSNINNPFAKTSLLDSSPSSGNSSVPPNSALLVKPSVLSSSTSSLSSGSSAGLASATSIFGKSILRQPRLQFTTSLLNSNPLAAAGSSTGAGSGNTSISAGSSQSGTGSSPPSQVPSAVTDGPFSLHLKPGTNLDSSKIFSSALTAAIGSNGTIAACASVIGSSCSICGIACNTRYYQQATKKFGVSCCDICRKFISKMVKKLASSSSPTNANVTMKCKNEGKCLIGPPSVIRPDHVKTRHIFKERCHACWLKKCLGSFQVPPVLKVRLTQTLPMNLRQTETASGSNNSSVKSDSAENNIFSNSLASAKTPLSSRMLWNASGAEKPDFSKSNSFLSLANPLAQNNNTFGSLPSIKLNISDKPMMLIPSSLSSPKGNKSPSVSRSEESSPSTDKEKKESEECDMTEAPTNSIRTRSKTEAATNAAITASASPVGTGSSTSTTTTTTNTTATITTSVVTASGTVATDPAIPNQPTGTVNPNDKRQRIDLKGPRVKHVCRSASIVLGQPLATFPEDESTLENIETPPSDSAADVTDQVSSDLGTASETPLLHPVTPKPDDDYQCVECKEPDNIALSPPATPTEADTSGSTEKELVIDEDKLVDSNQASPIKDIDVVKPEPPRPPPVVKVEVEVKEKEPIRKLEEIERPATRKTTSSIRPQVLKQNISAITKSFNTNVRAAGQQGMAEVPNVPLISIDFWENYDPAEVSRTGFGLILSEDVPLKALCFLCGSSGLDELLFCVCCCEPYHQYCVKDEYNIRTVSLDDTNVSLLELTSTTNAGGSSPQQQALNRFNWMCPRCTVCYTCNMAAGSKVKCQKCGKNYHTTCLGTSKRLLGADRPLICAGCLKCKSCSTTNVTKFIGNLPMCTPCFRLRQKGNFCPLCQRCYEDNDFDLKMMECGDCKRWVHAKCEGLTDEQYNMLSALPENIEFICKKCGKNNENGNVWRDAVAGEFKAGLLSVVKLLSKSRQACALLKLSPRKKTGNCSCSISSGKSITFFGFNSIKEESSSKKAKLDEQESIYDFNSESSSSSSSFPQNTKCYCSLRPSKPSDISLVEIKQKINANEYYSLQDFNYDMNTLINAIGSEDLSTAYKEFLSETFPWFQNETKACTDALEEAMCGEEMCDYNPAAGLIMDTDQKVPNIDIPLSEIGDYFYESAEIEDTRICMFCKQRGEGLPLHESRLLYCGQNNWVHTNCALWTAEVFEEIDGSLQNVHSAVSRGRSKNCRHCGVKGATVRCNARHCTEHFHFPCARQVGCLFLQDKTLFCPQHTADASRKKCQAEKSFEINRSVYVELDRRKKKFVEPGKVQFMIGSLSVKKLGHIVPMFSDHSDAIIPTDFECTRLYWSTKEPWKIVQYRIKTSIQNNNYCYGTDFGRNFTVDHSLNSSQVQWGLTQIGKWHNSLNSDDPEPEPISSFTGNQREKPIKQMLETGDDTNDEEPQSNNDLLPQEIKDAIFEDIPHDILDGISMLDILPKLMTYDDLIAMDLKNENNFNAEILKEVGLGSSSSSSSNSSNATGGSKDDEMDVDEDDINEAIMKCTSGELSNDGWMKSIGNPGIEDALLSAIKQPSSSRELKRSKTDILSRAVVGSRVAGQRSSSFSWNSKLESTAAVVAKRRKISKLADVLSLGRIKDESTANILERRRSLPCEEFSWSANRKVNGGDSLTDGMGVLEKLKISQLDGMDDFCGDSGEVKIYSSSMIEAPVKCDRCHATYRNQESYLRHLNSCEVLSTSESDSETRSPRLLSPEQQQAQVANQIGNGTFILPQTSQSISTDMYNQINQNQQTNPTISVISGLNNQTINLGNLNNQAILSNIPVSMPITINQLSSGIPIQTSTGTHQIPLQGTFSNIGGNMIISNQGQIFAQPINFQQPLDNQQTYVQNKQRFIQPAPSPQIPQTISLSNNLLNTGNGINVIPQQQQQQQIITIGPNGQPQIVTVTAPQTTQPSILQNHSQKKQLIFPTLSPKKQSFSRISQSPTPIKAKRITPTATATSNKTIHMKKQEPITIQQAATPQPQTIQTITQPIPAQQQQQQIQLINTSYPLIRPASAATPHQTTATTNNPIIFQQANQPIIVQQVGGNQISYVTDQNPVQYLATPTNVLTQNGFAMTAAGDGTLTAAANNILIPNGTGGYSMIPASALQLATPQPQVIGTIIQPQATTIQCGMMSTEQMVLGAAPTPTLEMVTDPTSGCMYLTSPSVYYGLETIVQNTVMSSQQFVSTAMQGVLSQNSSFSATTTQVFQASKIEPIVEVPTGYVVLNNDGTTSQQSLSSMQLQSPAGIIQQAQIPPTPSVTPSPQQQSIQSAATVSQPNSVQTWKIEPQSTFVQQHQPQTTTINPLKTSTGMKSIIPKAQPQLVNKVMPNSLVKTAENLNSSISSHFQTVSSTAVYTTATALATTTKVSNVIKPITKTINLNKPKIIAKPVKQRQSLLSPPLTSPQSPQTQQQQQKPVQQTAQGMSINSNSQPQLVPIKPSVNNEKPCSVDKIPLPTNSLSTKISPKNSVDFIPTGIQSTKPQSLLKKPDGKLFPRMTTNTPFQANQVQLQQLAQSIQINVIPNGNFNANHQQPAAQSVGQAQKSLLLNMDTQKKTSQITMTLATSSSTTTPTTPGAMTMANSSITITPTQTASITLPTAPYPMPLYSNIPTNVVNPIQQSATNNNTNSGMVQNRPTNRVLPMQASLILPKSPEVPPTPPPLKLLNTMPEKINEISIIPSHNFSPDSPEINQSDKLVKDSQLEIEIKPIEMIPQQSPIDDQLNTIDQQQSFQFSLSLDHHGSLIPVDNSPTVTSTDITYHPDIADIEIKSIDPTDRMFSETEEMLVDSMQEDPLDGASVDSPSLNDESESPEIKNKISEILDNLEQQTNEEDEFSDCKHTDSTELLLKIESEQVLKSSSSSKSQEEQQLVEELNQELQASANASPATTTSDLMIPPIFECDPKRDEDSGYEAEQKDNLDPRSNMASPAPSSGSNLLTSSESQLEVLEKDKVEQHPVSKPPKTSSPKLLYEIQSQDGFTYKSTSIVEIWDKLFEAVQIARKAHGLLPLPEGQLEEMAGVQMLGLKTNAMRYLLEQLPGVEKCSQYKPQYHKKAVSECSSTPEGFSSIYEDYFDIIKENQFGSARCEPYSSRSEYDMFSWLASRHRKQPMPVVAQNIDDTVIPRRGTGSNLPMAMRYRTLKETSKESVGVYRSHIHGRGLFCNRDIEAGEMVIEYAGELIRSTLTDKRERYYDSRGIGCYMFKIDENFVVDATMRGNAARFINHSCEPNCYSKVVDILGHKHIIIFAYRRIVQGEELTYDYKFPFEDVKIPCSCGSKKCRKYLN